MLDGTVVTGTVVDGVVVDGTAVGGIVVEVLVVAPVDGETDEVGTTEEVVEEPSTVGGRTVVDVVLESVWA